MTDSYLSFRSSSWCTLTYPLAPGGGGACPVVVEAARRWILAAGPARRLSLISRRLPPSRESRRQPVHGRCPWPRGSCLDAPDPTLDALLLSMATRALCCFPPLRESRLVMRTLAGPGAWFCRNLRIRAGPTLFPSLYTLCPRRSGVRGSMRSGVPSVLILKLHHAHGPGHQTGGRLSRAPHKPPRTAPGDHPGGPEPPRSGAHSLLEGLIGRP